MPSPSLSRNYDFLLSMDEVMGGAEKGPKKKREMNIGELLGSNRGGKRQERSAYFSMELHQRLAFPSACLLLGLLGPPLGSVFRQRSRMTGITVGVGIFLAYYVILSAGKGLGENDINFAFLCGLDSEHAELSADGLSLGEDAQGNSILACGTQPAGRPAANPGDTSERGVPGQMRIIPRYILRHFLPVFVLSILSFLGLYLVVDFFETGGPA